MKNFTSIFGSPLALFLTEAKPVDAGYLFLYSMLFNIFFIFKKKIAFFPPDYDDTCSL